MTNAQVLERTIALCDAAMARGLEAAEITLIDQGATEEEIEAALRPDTGYFYKLLRADRDAHIREVERWLSGNDNTLH